MYRLPNKLPEVVKCYRFWMSILWFLTQSELIQSSYWGGLTKVETNKNVHHNDEVLKIYSQGHKGFI